MTRQVVIYSGGMDSFTLLHELVDAGDDVHPLTFNYGQRQKKELACAQEVCTELGLPYTEVPLYNLSGILLNPIGDNGSNLPEAFIPNRNMLLLSIAITYAARIGASGVYFGALYGSEYPDCQLSFIDAMFEAARRGNRPGIAVYAPYATRGFRKKEVLINGLALGLDYSKTWSCYENGDKACGVCGACKARLVAFDGVGIIDPLEYEHG